MTNQSDIQFCRSKKKNTLLKEKELLLHSWRQQLNKPLSPKPQTLSSCQFRELLFFQRLGSQKRLLRHLRRSLLPRGQGGVGGAAPSARPHGDEQLNGFERAAAIL